MKIYFAHPISTYCSDIEKTALDLLRILGHEIINPSEEQHQNTCGSDMANWVSLAQTADAIAILPFSSGVIGAGVAMEAYGMKEQNKPIFAFTPCGNHLRILEQFPGALDILSLAETQKIIHEFKEERIEKGLPPIPSHGGTTTQLKFKP